MSLVERKLVVIADENNSSSEEEQQSSQSSQSSDLLDSERMKLLSSIWREANKPDNLLGTSNEAPSPQMVRQAGAMKIIKKLNMTSKSKFIDLGSGHGLVSMAASLMTPGCKSFGIELDSFKVEMANRFALRLENPQPNFWQGDLCLLKSIDEYSHIYTFDKEFPPKVLTAIGALLMRETSKWEMFVSAKNQRIWSKLFETQDSLTIQKSTKSTNSKKRSSSEETTTTTNWWDENVELFEKQQGALCGSGEGHMFYIYRRRRSQSTSQKKSTTSFANENDSTSSLNSKQQNKRQKFF